jgi:hypothetical protein
LLIGPSKSARVATLIPLMEPELVAEYEWEEPFDGTAYTIKTRVLQSGGKYDASVFLVGGWHPLHQWDWEPSDDELKARVKPEMPTWKAIGSI